MTELLHDGDMSALDGSPRTDRIPRRAGKIVFPGKQIKRTGGRVDPFDAAAQVAIDPIEVKIALEHAWPALLVAPQCLPACDFRALRGDQAGHQRRPDFATMDVGPVEPGGVIPRRLKIGGLEPDQSAEFAHVSDREIENYTPADGAPHHHRPL